MDIYLPHVHMHLCRPQCNDYMGVGAPMAHDVSSHRALKIQQKYNIWALIDVE